MKKIIFILSIIMFAGCGNDSATDNVTDSTKFVKDSLSNKDAAQVPYDSSAEATKDSLKKR